MDLHKAILKGDFLEVRRLVEFGVDVNRCDSEDRTPLMLCCLHNGEDWAGGVARMLLMHNGRVGLCDGFGRSALIYAVLYERVSLVQMFLRALDFDVTAPDHTGRTALDYASQTRNRAIMELVLQVMRRYGLPSQNSCSQNSQPTVQRIQEPQHQPASKAALKSVDSKTDIQSREESSSPVQNPEPGSNDLFLNLFPYTTLSKKLWTIQENIHQRNQDPKTVSNTISSKMETKIGEESYIPIPNLKPGPNSTFTNLLPYKTLSEKKWTRQETVQRTRPKNVQSPLHQPNPKMASKVQASSPIQNPEPGSGGVFTNPLPYRTLCKKLWTSQETVQRTLEPQHQAASTVASKVASKVVLEKVRDKTEVKNGDKSSPQAQIPEPVTNNMSKNPQPLKTTSKNIKHDSVQRYLESKDLQRSVKANEKTTHGRSPPVTLRNWRLDFRDLMEALQVQNSTSYRPQAQPHPPAQRRRQFPRAERSQVLGWKKSRKISLGALDESLQKEKMTRTYRRRCTLAAIPVIQLTKGRRTSVTGPENFKPAGEWKPSKTAGEIKLSKNKK